MEWRLSELKKNENVILTIKTKLISGTLKSKSMAKSGWKLTKNEWKIYLQVIFFILHLVLSIYYKKSKAEYGVFK